MTDYRHIHNDLRDRFMEPFESLIKTLKRSRGWQPAFGVCCSVRSPVMHSLSQICLHEPAVNRGRGFKNILSPRPVNTRLFSLFPFGGISLKKPICQLFANFRIGRMALHSGCRECCPVMSKDLQGSARHCKAVEGAGSHS